MNRLCLYALVLLSFLLGCNLEDERDVCCDTNVMHYRYTLKGVECFKDCIYRMHYYLFDADGRYLGQKFPDKGDMQRVSLEGLSPDKYTLIALANLDDYDTPDEDARGGLKDFEFIMQDFFPGTNELDSGNPLYWGASTFTIERGKSNRFVTEMANIHCIMHIHFEWEGLPPYSDGYTFQLEGVSEAYSLDPARSTELGIQIFPEHLEQLRNARRSVTLEDMALEIPIFTLRYRDDRIPKLRVWHEKEPITQSIDLGVAFQEWGWHPDMNPVQIYAVEVKLNLDGSVEVSPKANADVNDWENGGTIGM